MKSERRRIWISLLFAVLLTMLAFVCGGCAADTYTVCPGGSCNYSSIQAAVNATSGGDTIIARDGTYAENDKYLIAIGFILTILIFIASCFYAVRTSALNNMYTSEVNCYTYIKYADNTTGKEKYMYQDIAKKWYKDSNRAIDLHQKNCAFVVGSLYSFF